MKIWTSENETTEASKNSATNVLVRTLNPNAPLLTFLLCSKSFPETNAKNYSAKTLVVLVTDGARPRLKLAC